MIRSKRSLKNPVSQPTNDKSDYPEIGEPFGEVYVSYVV